jgi:hypothetical protein
MGHVSRDEDSFALLGLVLDLARLGDALAWWRQTQNARHQARVPGCQRPGSIERSLRAADLDQRLAAEGEQDGEEAGDGGGAAGGEQSWSGCGGHLQTFLLRRAIGAAADERPA